MENISKSTKNSLNKENKEQIQDQAYNIHFNQITSARHLKLNNIIKEIISSQFKSINNENKK